MKKPLRPVHTTRIYRCTFMRPYIRAVFTAPGRIYGPYVWAQKVSFGHPYIQAVL